MAVDQPEPPRLFTPEHPFHEVLTVADLTAEDGQ